MKKKLKINTENFNNLCIVDFIFCNKESKLADTIGYEIYSSISYIMEELNYDRDKKDNIEYSIDTICHTIHNVLERRVVEFVRLYGIKEPKVEFEITDLDEEKDNNESKHISIEMKQVPSCRVKCYFWDSENERLPIKSVVVQVCIRIPFIGHPSRNFILSQRALY